MWTVCEYLDNPHDEDVCPGQNCWGCHAKDAKYQYNPPCRCSYSTCWMTFLCEDCMEQQRQASDFRGEYYVDEVED